MFFSIGTNKKSMENWFQKGRFQREKNRPTLIRLTENGRPQVTFYYAAQRLLAVIVPVKESSCNT